MTDLPTTLLRTFGRLHVVLVHFPIALILAAALIELVAGRRAGERRSEAASICLLLGALAAVVTAASGWVNAGFEPHSRSIADTLLVHRWMGVATAVLALATLVASRVAARTTYRVGLFLTAAVVAVEAHLGGSLVHGEGYLTELFRAEVEPVRAPANDPAGDPAGDPATPPAPDLRARVERILAERCVRCHGPKRTKGKLRLDDLDAVLARTPPDQVVVPGEPAASELWERVTLPADDEDAMPAEGDPLTPAEVEIIGDWIRSLASAADSATDSAANSSVRPEPAPTDPAPATALAPLEERGVHVAPLAVDSNDLVVNLSLLGARAGDEELGLVEGLGPWLVELDLSRTAVTDAGLAALDGCTRLERLRLDWTAVTDAGLRHLAHLSSLESLNLVGTAVTDAGLARLEPLAGLRRLYVWRTDVTPGGADALRAALPQLELHIGGGDPGEEPARQ